MLADISKTIGKDFLIAGLVPATLVAGVNVLYVRWGLLPRAWFHDYTVFDVNKPVALLAAGFAVALGFLLFRTFIYRAFEGYERWTLVVGGLVLWAVGLVAQLATTSMELQWTATALRWAGAIGAAAGLVQAFTLHAHKRSHARWLARDLGARDRFELTRLYPLEPRQVLATRFGNVLRAFEEYPYRLWGIDPIGMWPRLVAVLPEHYAGQLDDAKILVTLSLNLCVTGVWLAVETALLAPGVAREKWLAASAIWALVALVAYRAAIAGGRAWGEYFRSAFDLYRIDLLKRLNVELPSGPLLMSEEQELWKRVQLVTFWAEDPGAQLKFVIKEGAPDAPPSLLGRFLQWCEKR